RAGRVHGRDREVALDAERQPLRGRAGAEDLAQLALQLAVAARVVGEARARPALEEVEPPHGLAEVAPERLLAGHEQHVPVARLVDLVADALAHPRRAGRAALVVVGGVAGHDVGRALVRLPALDPVPVHVRGRVALADLERAALARLARPDHRREDA